jgi:hypothetical protein
MQYVLLIYTNEAEYEARGAAKNGEIYQEYMKLNAELKERGQLRQGERLESVTTATTVRIKEGKLLKTDGPFAETREQLGGFYIVEAKDHDEAVAIAARIPGARFGSIEVRPIMSAARMAR